MRRLTMVSAAASAAALLVLGMAATGQAAQIPQTAPTGGTATPIKHLVVLFSENVSFDHYFGTYPKAANTDGTPFHARTGTPTVNGLTDALLHDNPNATQPKRLGPAQAVTCDQGHGYGDEQKAFDGGRMDKFVEYTDRETCDPRMYTAPGLVMDYYDGNTVTAMWNYAQRFAMSDNSYDTTFGPSTPGALNLVSGQTHGALARSADGTVVDDAYAVVHPGADHVGTVINDPQPYFDDCSNHARNTVEMTGPNIGDLLNRQNVSWGWFEGGFRPTATTGGQAVCGTTHANVAGVTSKDYIPHHQPFQYYKSTANPHHAAPASVAEIGHAGPANHLYDTTDFDAALAGHNLPSVSFVKAPAYQDGHAAYSDPLDEQHFMVDTVNKLQESPYWKDTAVVVAYDDSDGWYDHQMSQIVNPSVDSHDALTAPGMCGHGTPLSGYEARCGYGPRLPLLVLSPYARTNFVDHTLTDQSSVLRFVEDNWLSGARIGGGSFDALAGSLAGMFDWSRPTSGRLILDPVTGARTDG